MTHCPRCGKDKDESEFYPNKKEGGIRKPCRECCKEKEREFYKNRNALKIARIKKYRQSERGKQFRQQQRSRQVNNLSRAYVVMQLKKKNLPITDEMIEIQRAKILITRLKKKLKGKQ